MDIFDFCLEVIEHEGQKFNLSLEKFNSSSENPITAATANDINYDIALNRCAYIYRCGSITLFFARECFTKFITEYEDLIPLMSKWNNSPNLTLCSFTNGPVFDYIALLLSFNNYLPATSLSLFKEVYLVSKYGAWRNTANIVQQVLNEKDLKPFTGLSIGNVEVIQGDPFQSFSDKVKSPISKSDVITMIKCIKFQQDDASHEVKLLNALMELFEALKPDAILFCIDTKPVTTLIINALTKYSGKFLFEPILVNSSLCLDCPDFCKDRFGCSPIMSARGIFFVWQKSSAASAKAILENTIKHSNNISIRTDATYSSIVSSGSCNGGQTFTNGANYSSVSSCSSENYNDSNLRVSTTPTFTGPKYSSQYAVENTEYNAQPLASSVLFKNKVSTFDDNLNNEKHQIDRKHKIENNSLPFSTSVQTDGEKNNSVETDSAKIVALTNRVMNLTKSISELLQTTKLQSACEKKISKCCRENNENPVPNDITSNRCSFIPNCHTPCVPVSQNICVCCRDKCMANFGHICQQACVAHTPCVSVSPNMHVCCREKSMVNCCHVCQEAHAAHTQSQCKALHNNAYQASKYCTSCCNGTNFERKGVDSPVCDTPNLVIPLNSLPKDIVSQIISSLSKSD